jgi:PleD family two-component response regulator
MNGSAVRILPRGLRPRAVTSIADGESLLDRSPTTYRILVIDDDTEIRNIIGVLLRGAAYRVAAADHSTAVDCLFDWLEAQSVFAAIKGTGHRVVHGMNHSEPERIAFTS